MIQFKLDFMSKLFLLFLITLSLADNLKNIEEVDVVDIGSQNRLSEIYNAVDARRDLLSLPDTAVIPFPFEHVCVGGKKKTRRVKLHAESSFISTKDLKQKAVKGLMQMIVAFTPVKTLCMGNLIEEEFMRQKDSNTAMQTLSCSYLEQSNRAKYVSNIGFAVKIGNRLPGFCSTLSTDYNDNLTFQLAFNRDMVNTVIEKIPRIGKLLASVSTSQIALGISEGGYLEKKFNYWKDYERTKILGAHAYLKMNIVFDAIRMVEQHFRDYKSRKGSLPTKFVSLIGDLEAWVRFYGSIDEAIDCVFGAEDCSTDDIARYLFDTDIYISGTGKVEFDMTKLIGILPKISIDLKGAHVWKSHDGIFFKWKMNDILSVLGELINETIGKIDGMPTIKSEAVEFDAYISNGVFAFQGKYLGSTLKCKVDFNSESPVNCEFNNKYFSLIAETLDAIEDAGKAIFIETKGWAETTGTIISKGYKSTVEVGAKVIDGATKGVIEIADQLGDEVDAILNGKKDWCDCNKKGKLRIWASGTDTYELSAKSNWQMINWGKKVTSVSWKCTDGGNTQTAKFSNGGSTWMLKFTHEKKWCKKNDNWWDMPANYSSGRIYWK